MSETHCIAAAAEAAKENGLKLRKVRKETMVIFRRIISGFIGSLTFWARAVKF